MTASLLLLTAVTLFTADDDCVSVAPARRGADGFIRHHVKSTYQGGETLIRILLPDGMAKGRRYPVVYVLPVEAGLEGRYGDGLLEIKRRRLHQEYDAIFVSPTFSQLPWYADHPTDPEVRQETYFLRVVVPFIERSYPASTNPTDRLLLGFSKSGWGAWTMLLRHGNAFGGAAAWDAPLLMEDLGKYGTPPIFGTQENFEVYRPAPLLRKNAPWLRSKGRLVLTGFGNFREQHQRAHLLLGELRIPHHYRDGPQREHHWHSGWVPQAVKLLLESKRRGGR